MEEAQRNYASAISLRQMLENKMDIRAKIIRTNTGLLQELDKVSTLNQSILEQEVFTTEQSQQYLRHALFVLFEYLRVKNPDIG